MYKKYRRGQDMGELAMREITGMLWMADPINRAKSVEPAALAKAANETDMKPDQMIIDYKGIKFDKNRQNELATGVVTQIGWDDDKHTVWPWDPPAQAGFKPIYPSPPCPAPKPRPKNSPPPPTTFLPLVTSDHRFINQGVLTGVGGGNLTLGGVRIGGPLLVGGLIALGLFLLLYLLIDRTDFGLALQATAEDRDAAMLVGIRPQRMYAVAWGLGTALVAVAAVILATFFSVYPQAGLSFTVLPYAT